jgi:hypothetical protein
MPTQIERAREFAASSLPPSLSVMAGGFITGRRDGSVEVQSALAAIEAGDDALAEAFDLIRDIFSGKVDVINSESGINRVGEFIIKHRSENNDA